MDLGHISLNSVEFISSSLALTVNTNVAPPGFEFCVKPNYPNIVIKNKRYFVSDQWLYETVFYEIENGFCVYTTKKITIYVLNIE